ncbi:MAG: hypothetical protein AB7G52_10405 [Arcobacter sp.]
MKKFTVKENISRLLKDEIFVFGSNLKGVHGKGSAKTAYLKFGAKLGVGEGLVGNTYAIPTKDKDLNPLSLDMIQLKILSFFNCCLLNKNKTFIVTRIGCGYAGYKDNQIAPLFSNSPDNVLLPEVWKLYLKENPYISSFLEYKIKGERHGDRWS